MHHRLIFDRLDDEGHTPAAKRRRDTHFNEPATASRKIKARSVVKFIVQTDQSLDVSNSLALRELLEEAAGGEPVTLPTRHELESCMQELRQAERHNIQAALQEPSNTVWLTIDGWTTNTQFRFINVSAHVFTSEWDRLVRSLGTRELPENHSAQNIYDHVVGVLENYGITFDRVTGITTDGEPTMHALHNIIQRHFQHVIAETCAIHTLQLPIKHSFDQASRASELFQQIRSVFQHIKASGPLTQQLRDIQKTSHREAVASGDEPASHRTLLKGVVIDEPTCWDSKLHVLARCQELLSDIERLRGAEIAKLLPDARNRGPDQLTMPANLTTILPDRTKTLEAFESATKQFSASNHLYIDLANAVQDLRRITQEA